MRPQNVSHVHPSALVKKEYTFLEKQLNFAEIIKYTFNINVNCYANNDKNTKLFVFKTSCYKRLLKFQ